MLFTDYIDEVADDAREVIANGEYDWCEDLEQVVDELWTDDSVTGNGSGSYYFDAEKARQATRDLIWDSDFLEELEGLGWSLAEALKDGPEALDVTARCLALGLAHDEIREAWEARAEELEEAEEAEEA